MDVIVHVDGVDYERELTIGMIADRFVPSCSRDCYVKW